MPSFSPPATRPSGAGLERGDAIGRELGDVVAEFDAWASRELGPLNTALSAKQLAPIPLLTHAQWEAAGVAGQE